MTARDWDATGEALDTGACAVGSSATMDASEAIHIDAPTNNAFRVNNPSSGWTVSEPGAVYRSPSAPVGIARGASVTPFFAASSMAFSSARAPPRMFGIA